MLQFARNHKHVNSLKIKISCITISCNRSLKSLSPQLGHASNHKWLHKLERFLTQIDLHYFRMSLSKRKWAWKLQWCYISISQCALYPINISMYPIFVTSWLVQGHYSLLWSNYSWRNWNLILRFHREMCYYGDSLKHMTQSWHIAHDTVLER